MRHILFETRDLEIGSEIGTAAALLSLRFMTGETVALIGERDSGRLGFFDYLCGRASCSSGKAWGEHHTDGEEWLRTYLFVISDEDFHDPSGRMGISILESLYLVRAGGCRTVLWEPEAYENECRELLEMLGVKRSPEDDIGSLTRLEQMELQIAKGLLIGAKIIAIEEDFEGFSPSEIGRFAVIMGKLKLERELCFVWSTNGLRAVSDLADRILVFSGGTVVKQLRDEEELTPAGIEALMRQPDVIPHIVKTRENNKPLFRAEDLTLNRLPFTLSLFPGEVISIVEYDTEDKLRLYQILSGQRSGKLFLDGERLPKRWSYRREKYAVIGLDSFGEKGMFANLSPAENLFLPSLRKASKPGIFVPSAGYQAVWIEWNKRHPHAAQSVSEMNRADRLSLQLESWLIFNPKVMILLEPFLHLDQQGRGIFSRCFREFREHGTGIIVLSSSRTNYLGDEAIALETGLFDRIIYTENGRVINETE